MRSDDRARRRLLTGLQKWVEILDGEGGTSYAKQIVELVTLGIWANARYL